MSNKARVGIEPKAVAMSGVNISTGELLGGSNDGLDFVYVANAANPANPLIAMPVPVTAFAIYACTIALENLTEHQGDELLAEKLSLLKAVASEVAEMLIPDE